MPPTDPTPPAGCAVNNLVAYAHVMDVDASLAFYALLGFIPTRTLKDHAGRAFWSRAGSGKGEIMLARASGPIDAEQQAVLFYMYSDDVAALRTHLLANGLHDGSTFTGSPGPNSGLRVAFAISHPNHMPAGELRITDPDGYVVLVGQLQ